MSFFANIAKKLKKKKAPGMVDRAPAEKPSAPAEPTRSAPADLDELRFRARTGDPKLTDRHHKGNF
ncbi:MAG: hypothetical protein K6F56_02535 [Oscillospiraceae bacterium]|nr:hypothetical protein [Oscillospiraceae bacterium]